MTRVELMLERIDQVLKECDARMLPRLASGPATGYVCSTPLDDDGSIVAELRERAAAQTRRAPWRWWWSR